MAKYCPNCKKEISKFDSDVCPHCGGISPIEDNYKTMDVTTSFGKYGEDISLYKSKSHKKFALLCMLLGMVGVHNFYIHKQKMAYINIAISILFIACLGLILYFSGAIKNYYLALINWLKKGKITPLEAKDPKKDQEQVAADEEYFTKLLEEQMKGNKLG